MSTEVNMRILAYMLLGMELTLAFTCSVMLSGNERIYSVLAFIFSVIGLITFAKPNPSEFTSIFHSYLTTIAISALLVYNFGTSITYLIMTIPFVIDAFIGLVLLYKNYKREISNFQVGSEINYKIYSKDFRPTITKQFVVKFDDAVTI